MNEQTKQDNNERKILCINDNNQMEFIEYVCRLSNIDFIQWLGYGE